MQALDPESTYVMGGFIGEAHPVMAHLVSLQ
jgi:hypothetical protein